MESETLRHNDLEPLTSLSKSNLPPIGGLQPISGLPPIGQPPTGSNFFGKEPMVVDDDAFDEDFEDADEF